MQFYVLQGESQLGPYQRSELQLRVNDGTFALTDLAWGEGLPDWVPLSQLVKAASPVSPALPATARASSLEKARRLALAGVALLVFGVFSPYASVPLFGGITFLKVGWPAYVVLALAAVSALTLMQDRLGFLWVTGLAALLVVGGTVVNFHFHMQAAKADLLTEGGGTANFGRALGGAMLESVQLQWGCIVLSLGAILIMAAASVASRK